jgi:hypothetical protein
MACRLFIGVKIRMSTLHTTILVAILAFGLGMVWGIKLCETSAHDNCGSRGSWLLLSGERLDCSSTKVK